MVTSTTQNRDGSAPKPLQFLCLEDNLKDRLLLEETVRGSGLSCDFAHVMTRADFEAALKQQRFDLIISDYTLPQFDGLSALALAKKLQSDTPYIFFSGTIGEEVAIASLKNGATDYVLKDRRERLSSAVHRALREGQERQERLRLAEQLRQSQKMDAIGQLAGGVAHDFNNLLAIIQGSTELALRSDGNLKPATRNHLLQISKTTERAAKLTRQLLAFSRKTTVELKIIDLEEVIWNLVAMMTRIVEENIRLEYHAEGTATIRADAGMIEQVLMNLILNARDAMPRGGLITITTAPRRLEASDPPTHVDARPGEFIRLAVSDTGIGIDPQHLPHIFEPFFTTKEVSKGSGLGLATAYGIVKQHQGWIDVQSAPNAGATFSVYLPTTRPADAPILPTKTIAQLPRGTETILLVEDNDDVRAVTRQTLEQFGYQVIEAASGAEALQLREPYQLLLTDMVMPGHVNGRELAERLRARTPGLKVIYASGYSPDATGMNTEFLFRPNTYFLPKPYHLETLIQTVRASLDTAALHAP